MACIVDLFSKLGGPKDTGGNWFITDEPNNFSSPFDINYGTCTPAATTLTITGDNQQIGSGEDICVDLVGLDAGDYVFTYVLPDPNDPTDCGTGCVGCASVTITVLEEPVDGAGVEYCQNDPAQKNLYALLGNSPSTDGNWNYSGPGTWPNGESDNDIGDDDYFIPNEIGVGVHTFTYTINSSEGCTECQATIEVTITAAPSAGTDGEASICG